MKTADDKISYKNHFFKLGQGRLIPRDNVEYWRVFWQWPTAASHIFDLLTPYDIQTVRDQNLPNFLTLVHVLCSNIIGGQKESFVNSARMLAKILPFLFEMPDYDSIEERLFLADAFDPMVFASKHPCTPKHGVILPRPQLSAPAALAPALVRALVASLGEEVWEMGLGCSGSYAVPDLSDTTRSDTLRLLTVLASRSFYEAPGAVCGAGNVFLTSLVSMDAAMTRVLVCSLINTVCRAGRVARGDSGLEGVSGSALVLRFRYVLACGQLMGRCVLYAVPPHHHAISAGSNGVQAYISSMGSAADLQFVASHLLAILRSPFAENGHSAEQPQNPSPLTLSAILLLRELYQNNPVFQQSVAARLAVKLVPCVLYHVYAFYDRLEYEHTVKAASVFLVELSGKANLNRQLLLTMHEQFMEQLPPEFRISGHISTRDFATIHACQVILTLAPPPQTASKYSALPIRQFLLSRLTEFLYNVIPCTSSQIDGTDHAPSRLANTNPGGGISYRACTYVNSVIAAFSTRDFLVARPEHAQLLALLLRALCTTVSKNPPSARMLLVTFLENEAMYDNIWTTMQGLSSCYFMDTTLHESSKEAEPEIENGDAGSDGGEADEEEETDEFGGNDSEIEPQTEAEMDPLTPVPPAGMSEQRRQKLPQETPLSETWGGTGSLHIILVIIIPFLKQHLGDVWCKRGEKTASELYAVAASIGRSNLERWIAQDKRCFHYDSWPETPAHVLRLTWNDETRGWLVGVVGYDVYAGADIVRSYVQAEKGLMGNLSSSLAMFSKFASGWSTFGGGTDPAHVQEDPIAFSTNIWAGTGMRLFSAKTQDRRIFGLRLGSVGSTASVNELTSSLARKFRMGSRSSASSTVSTPALEEMPEFPRLAKRDSVSSLHSLNTLNRARSYTPRSSISNC